jgi:hypothetical protein
MNEFFAALNHDTPRGSDVASLPLCSPDSITVTTEFGVLEETGNVTVITAGVSYLHDHVEEDEENSVEMTEDVSEDQFHGASAQFPNTHTALPLHLAHAPGSGGVEAGAESSNDTGEEADIDTDDFDPAPVPDDGALTPTATTGHQT